ncbi:MAG: DNA topoisomerase III [Peptococcaceae bacterium]|jgi:DNA topoisomerase-3|nr:DNA topoisomerase III [Peptococcaceae bacterium]
MGKVLVIAEKPSVGRDIARVLGCREKGDGLLAGGNYIVSWAVGHLAALCNPEDYNPAWKKWSMETLPIMPEQMQLQAVVSGRAQLAVLKKLLRSPEVESLICATDSGREGELIFRYIYQLCGCRKPFRRLWVSSMTDEALREGFASLRPGADYDNLFASARCRSEADWLVGINASRAYTLKYNTLLSIGRVQTPTLAIIVARAQEIAAFVPEEYWELRADFALADGQTYWGVWQDKQGKTRLVGPQAAEQAKALQAAVKGRPAQVLQVGREEKSQPPPLLYDLTELQRDCNRRYGYSAQKTLDIAQSLYERRKLLTYPRTDSRYLSDDLAPHLASRVQRLAGLTQFSDLAAPLLGQPLPLSKRIIDNSKISDHHAIIPTEGNLRLEGLTPDELRVFRLVALRFLAVFYPPYRYAVTKVLTQVQTEANPQGELFASRGQEVLQAGWQAVYQQLQAWEAAETPPKKTATAKKSAKEDDQQLPSLQEGQPAQVLAVKSSRKKTQPPKPYTEAGLLSAMENAGRFVEDEALREQLKENGLGTPATRAAIIERLLKVGYIRRQGKNLLPTEKGERLMEVVPPELKSPETTGKWERGLSAIAGGRMTDEVFMASIRRYVQYLVHDCRTSNRFVRFPEEPRRYKSAGSTAGRPKTAAGPKSSSKKSAIK